MMPAPYQKDLIILVADKNMEHALKGLLSRPPALRIRDITFDLYVHPNRDGGCLSQGDEFLRTFVRLYSHALVIFDHEGCGREGNDSFVLERTLETNALFNKLAQAVSFERCTDPAFIRLKNILRSWFPASSAESKI